MIIELSVKNFGPIRNTQTLSFEATKDTTLEEYYVVQALPNLRLLKCIIMYGPNASGKSTILSAIDFLRDLSVYPADQKSEPLDFQPFLFDTTSQNEVSTIAIAFIHKEVRYNYSVDFTQQYIASERLDYYPEGRRANIYERSTDTDNQLSHIRFRSTVKPSKKDQTILTGNTLWNTTVLGAFTKSNVLIPALRDVVEWFTTSLLQTITPGTDLFGWTSKRVEESKEFKDKVIQIVRKADVQIDDLEITEDEQDIDDKTLSVLSNVLDNAEELKKLQETRKFITKDIIFHHAVKTENGRQTYKLLSAFESQGTRRYYGLSGVLATLMSTGSILTVDELESSLHPDLVQHFILEHLVHSSASQLLVTTHNVFLLDNQDILRRDAVWFTQKQDNGAIELFSLADFDSATLRNGASIINHYKIGKLGAKPRLGNVFLK